LFKFTPEAENLIHIITRTKLHYRRDNRWICAGLLLLLLFAACNPSPPISTRTPAATRTAGEPTPTRQAAASTPAATLTATLPPASTVDVAAEELNGVQIVFWHPYSDAEADALRRLAESFNDSNQWGILVSVEAIAGPDALEQRLDAALEAGSSPGDGLPDLAAGFLHQALAWNEQHPLADLRSYTDDPIWGYSLAEQADFFPAFWEQDVVDGRRLGLPFHRSAQVLLYNTTWANELGFRTPPATPQQLADQACAAAEANPANDGTGGLLVTPHYAAALSWIYSFGGEILRQPEPAAGRNVYRFSSDETEEAFTYLRNLYDDRCAWAIETGGPETEFAARRALLAPVSLADLAYLAEVMQQTGSQDQWTVIAYPSSEETPGIATYGTSLVVFEGSEARQLAAWLFASWLVQAENHARWVEAAGGLPLRQSEPAQLEAFSSRSPQWAAALALLPTARPEPAYASWDLVRWAIQDAFTQLFRSYFAADQIPTMLNFLDNTAEELHESD
jgi:ABC-type glycerol-3-phosphate transport system substrate-binding protein